MLVLPARTLREQVLHASLFQRSIARSPSIACCIGVALHASEHRAVVSPYRAEEHAKTSNCGAEHLDPPRTLSECEVVLEYVTMRVSCTCDVCIT